MLPPTMIFVAKMTKRQTKTDILSVSGHRYIVCIMMSDNNKDNN